MRSSRRSRHAISKQAMEQAAFEGNRGAQNNLGNHYYREGNYRQAAIWWEKAATQNSLEAQNKLACLYYRGDGTGSPNFEKSRTWWERAAKEGNARAMHNLGCLYAEGKGVVRDADKARELWEEAADEGHAVANNWLKAVVVKSNCPPIDVSFMPRAPASRTTPPFTPSQPSYKENPGGSS